jgi:predicted nucleotidyltransferase component of viral defense system
VIRFPDRRYYARIANSTGFRPEPLEKVFRLVTLLQTVDQQLGSELSLRGGTALNLLHLDVPRLSVDLDLDYIGSADPDEARARRPSLLQMIEDAARASGYEVVPDRPSYAMAHLRMHYDDIQGLRGFLKVDVNFLDRVPVMAPERRGINHPFDDDLEPFEVQTLALPELAAAKIIALCRRALARDLFDAAALRDLGDLDTEEVRTLLAVRGAAYPPPSPAEYTVKVVDRIPPARWNSEVVALARRPTPMTLPEARHRARLILDDVLKLSEWHRRFLDFLDAGEIRPDVLPIPALHPRISANPGLAWRLRVGASALEER